MAIVRMRNPKKPDPAGVNVLYYDVEGQRWAVAPGVAFPIDAKHKAALVKAGFVEVE